MAEKWTPTNQLYIICWGSPLFVININYYYEYTYSTHGATSKHFAIKILNPSMVQENLFELEWFSFYNYLDKQKNYTFETLSILFLLISNGKHIFCVLHLSTRGSLFMTIICGTLEWRVQREKDKVKIFFPIKLPSSKNSRLHSIPFLSIKLQVGFRVLLQTQNVVHLHLRKTGNFKSHAGDWRDSAVNRHIDLRWLHFCSQQPCPPHGKLSVPLFSVLYLAPYRIKYRLVGLLTHKIKYLFISKSISQPPLTLAQGDPNPSLSPTGPQTWDTSNIHASTHMHRHTRT